jgi:hypothetical protein
VGMVLLCNLESRGFPFDEAPVMNDNGAFTHSWPRSLPLMSVKHRDTSSCQVARSSSSVATGSRQKADNHVNSQGGLQ